MVALLLCGCSSNPRVAELRAEIDRIRAEHKQLETNLPVLEERRAQVMRLREEILTMRGLVDELKARRKR